ncbi:unnamed protein product [Bursaphelenchus xylophilus]|uniref:(pine wood nematode) hypothetical protein n=1 Tax=Bursaphelenchus xylophilus TaxID=6326 RepID=A0A7I8XJ31_BURXY|nr:unnamed protein product [Bursaphelenchus xylophilus]CAG9121159.1 unnamed protein product [Bursaphelenchus xylophilus]
MNKIISNGPTIVVTGLAIISLMLAIRLPIKQKRRPSMEMSANIVNVLASFGFVLAIWIDCLVIWVDCKAIVFVGKVATFIGHLWLATASVRNRLDPTATKLNPWPHLRRNAIAYYAGGAAAASAVLLFELPMELSTMVGDYGGCFLQQNPALEKKSRFRRRSRRTSFLSVMTS